jgi:Mor family transcriptional regulator
MYNQWQESQPKRKAMNGGNDDFDILKKLIGKEELYKVIEILGGSTIYIPKRDSIGAHHNSIKQEFRNGASYHELAIKYGYTKSYIRKIVHK